MRPGRQRAGQHRPRRHRHPVLSRLRPLAGIAAVVFDMDGVLVDSEPIHFEAMQRLLQRYGVHYTETHDRAFRGRRNLDLYASLRPTRPGLPADAVLDAELTAITLPLIAERCPPMPGVPDTLVALHRRGYRLALASSAVPAIIAAVLSSLGAAPLFAATVSGVEVAQGKPAPDIFLEAARRLRTAAPHCLVIEDSPNGVQAARAAAMPCVAIPCPATRHEDLSAATLRLPALPGLLDVLPPRPHELSRS